ARAGAAAAAYMTVVNSLFERNACTADGCVAGALFGGASLTAQDTEFVSNTARLDGGAVKGGVDYAILTGGRFQGNTCTQAGCTGGGLSAPAPLTLSQTVFMQNSSQGNGGGAYADSAATVEGGQFTGNTCAEN